MRAKGRFSILVLALLSLLVLTPHQTWAAADPSNIPTGADAPLVTTNCTANNQTDAAYYTNKAAHLQRMQNSIQALHTLYPVANAMTACVQNIMNIMAKLPKLADPLGLVGTIITQMLVGVISSTCAQVMGTITSIQTAITNMAKICIPLPKFNGLDLPKFNAPACSGGLVISPLSSWSASPPLVRTTTNPYLR